MVGLREAKHGIRMTGPLTTLTALAATAATIYPVSNAAAGRGNKSFKIKRIKLRDVASGGTVVHFGVGQGGLFVEAFALVTVNNFNADFAEGDLPEVEFTADMTAYSDVVTVIAQVEVEEIG